MIVKQSRQWASDLINLLQHKSEERNKVLPPEVKEGKKKILGAWDHMSIQEAKQFKQEEAKKK